MARTLRHLHRWNTILSAWNRKNSLCGVTEVPRKHRSKPNSVILNRSWITCSRLYAGINSVALDYMSDSILILLYLSLYCLQLLFLYSLLFSISLAHILALSSASCFVPLVYLLLPTFRIKRFFLDIYTVPIDIKFLVPRTTEAKSPNDITTPRGSSPKPQTKPSLFGAKERPRPGERCSHKVGHGGTNWGINNSRFGHDRGNDTHRDVGTRERVPNPRERSPLLSRNPGRHAQIHDHLAPRHNV
mgnify:CR=1 FL=1